MSLWAKLVVCTIQSQTGTMCACVCKHMYVCQCVYILEDPVIITDACFLHSFLFIWKGATSWGHELHEFALGYRKKTSF